MKYFLSKLDGCQRITQAYTILSLHHSVTVNCHYDEADERKDEADVDGWPVDDDAEVDDGCLERWEHRAAEDCHDEACSTELGIIAKSLKGNAIDGREHERHTAADAYEAIYAEACLRLDHADGKQHGNGAEDKEHESRIQPFHDICADEARADEQHHGIDIELL